MKSVTIRDLSGKILLKVIHRKSGLVDVEKHNIVTPCIVEVRDEKGHKTMVKI